MGNKPLRVLIVDDDEAMREVLAARLDSWGYGSMAVSSGTEALEAIRRDPPDMVLVDIVIPGMSGFDLMDQLQQVGSFPPVIAITAHGSIDWAVDAMKKGATDFLTKPLDHAHLKAVLDSTAVEIGRRRSAHELARQLGSDPGLGRLVGRSRRMCELYDLVRLLTHNEASALICGESGTGKELVAKTIHELSRRADHPFVAINTAAVPSGLMEAEIFGHEKGAFTGASQTRPGCFELADGGTLLLDEIGEMPRELQPKLLRVLEERRARRIGGSHEITFDVRVLAATNREPDELIEQGHLREDLFYRLNVFTVIVPPLRDHPDDIPLLAQHFVALSNEKHGLAVDGLIDESRELLQAYSWPGNVRELRNVIERAAILTKEGWVEPSRLPPYIVSPDAAAEPEEPNDRLVLPLGISAAEAERRLILKTLEVVDHNKAEAARRLQLDVKTVRNKLKKYAGEEKR